MRTSRTETRLTDRFKAKGSDGKVYEVHEYVDFIETTGMASQHPTWIGGLKSYRLSTGGAVNCSSETEFTVVATGVKLTKIS